MRCLTVEECAAWREAHSRRRSWKRQTTCHTPLSRLPWFTAALVGQLLPFDRALLVVDAVVFDDPPELVAIRKAAGERRPLLVVPGHLFEDDAKGFRAALEVTLSGWVDFRVLFSPTSHALWADHDEYTTFFSKSPGKVADVRRMMEAGGVKLPEYERKQP